MKLLRFITLLLCLISIGLLGVYSQRLAITERILINRLTQTGWTTNELVIDKIDFYTISISSFSASFSDGPVQDLSFTNLDLQFQPKEILKGSVAKLEIESLHLQLDPKQLSGSKKSTLSFAKIRQYIPQDISITQLSITTPEFSEDVELEITVKNIAKEAVAIHIIATAEELVLQQWQMENFKGDIFLSTEDGEKIFINNTSTIQFDRLAKAHTIIEGSLFSFSALIQKEPATSNWQLPQSKFDITIEKIAHNDIQIQPSPVVLEIQGQALPPQIRATFFGNELSIQHNERATTLQKLKATLLASGENINLKVHFSPELLPGLISVHINHNVIEGEGTATLSTARALDLQNTSDSFQKILENAHLPLRITNGLINGNGKIDWKDKQLQHAQASFTLREGAGNYGETAFNGLIIEQNLQLFPVIKTLSNGYISASEITNGVTLSNFSIRNQLLEGTDPYQPQLLIESIQTEVFGGIVSSKQIRIDPQRPDFESLIHLNRIDLKEIVQLIKVKGLDVTGTLDGTIVLHVNNKVVTVPEGKVHSRAPGGSISYFPPGGSANFSTLPAYALKALEEFNYNILTATPTYYDDGTLTITIHTEGHSPPLKTNRPVHLNLNTEQNILSLLESLRYSNQLTDKLEKQLQEKVPEN